MPKLHLNIIIVPLEFLLIHFFSEKALEFLFRVSDVFKLVLWTEVPLTVSLEGKKVFKESVLRGSS